MGDIVRFSTKSEIERNRLIQEARAIYHSIFPSIEAVEPKAPDSSVVDDKE